MGRVCHILMKVIFAVDESLFSAASYKCYIIALDNLMTINLSNSLYILLEIKNHSQYSSSYCELT